jgi:hypothetical protein
VTLRILPEQDHFFMRLPGEPVGVHRFGEMELSPEMLSLQREWIVQRTTQQNPEPRPNENLHITHLRSLQAVSLLCLAGLMPARPSPTACPCQAAARRPGLFPPQAPTLPPRPSKRQRVCRKRRRSGPCAGCSDSGQPRWQFETGAAVDASPVIAGNRLFVQSRDGYFYALDKHSGELIWRSKPANPARSISGTSPWPRQQASNGRVLLAAVTAACAPCR